MSGRPTAEQRIERLRRVASSPYVPGEAQREMNFAADCLAEIDALRPPCPRCGGTHKGAPGMGVDGQRTWAPCPDCPPDGKVPIERLVKVFEAVQAVRSSGRWVEFNGWNTNDPAELLSHLRGIR